MKSDRTIKCKKRARLFNLLHLACVLGPFLYFIPYCFIFSDTGRKLFLSLELITVLILSFISLLSDLKNRGGYSKIIFWLFIIGVTYCLQEVKIFIYIMSLCVILDELIFVKLRNKYRTAFIANKEIDLRG